MISFFASALMLAGSVFCQRNSAALRQRWTVGHENRQQLQQALARFADEEWRARAAKAEQAWAEVESAVPPHTEDAPAMLSDLHLEIARFLAMNRATAAAAGVRLRAEEAFGLGTLVKESPKESQRARVRREMALVRRILSVLFATKIDTLEGVWLGGEQKAVALRSGEAGSLFTFDKRHSLSVSDQAAPLAIKVQFTGSPEHVRRALDAIQAGEQSWFVRRLTAETTDILASPRAGTKSEPHRDSERLKITLVVEEVTGIPATGVQDRKSSEHSPRAGYSLFRDPRNRGQLGAGKEEDRGRRLLAESRSPGFPFSIKAIRRLNYPLQLAGYFGSPPNCQVALSAEPHGEILLVKRGEVVPSHGIRLTDVLVEKVVLMSNEAGAVEEVVARVTLRDDSNGAEVVLNTREPTSSSRHVVSFEGIDAADAASEYGEGNCFAAGEATYRVERIDGEGGEVVVARLADGEVVAETKVFTASLAAPAELAVSDLGSRESFYHGPSHAHESSH